MVEYKLCDLFAGTGAFSLAFENTKKVKTIFANDFCKNSKKIYDENFTTKLTLKDIHDIDVIDIPKMNILTSGFPCQPFSIAGEQRGFMDERSNTFWKLVEIIKYHKPDVVVFENVKNLQSHDEGRTFAVIIEEIKKLKYYYKHAILNTCIHSKIPQNRERIYIVCFRNKDYCDKFIFPKPVETINKLQIKDMLEQNILPKYYYTIASAIWTKLVNSVINKNVIYQYRRYYVRENKNNVCPTLTANMGTGGHNVGIIKDDIGIRKLTPRECFNFQGFPIEYKFPKLSDAPLYKLAGNAVSYPIVESIANNIINILLND